MFNAKQRDELIREFRNKVEGSFESINSSVEESMKAGDSRAVIDGVKRLQNLAIAAIPVGIAIPKASLYVSPMGEDEITLVYVTLSNKINSEEKFSYKTSVNQKDADAHLFSFIEEVYADLVQNEIIKTNLAKVNNVLSQAVAEAGLSYAIRVISPIGTSVGKKIFSMTDDEIVFVANAERALDLDDMLIFYDAPDEVVSEEMIQGAYSKLVETLTSAQTPEQLVGIHGGSLISLICDISKRIKPATLIKAVCTKDVKKLRGDNDAVAFYQEGNTYALVARRSGNYEVILSPFDLEDLHRVDVDVLDAIA